ncbi:DUF7064 domain-containing protein [Sphingomonas sp. ID0503]|uniref:DUF7064 domain-containing protein n=1 Tax=Sphingomonas sp. ID0503 TaxID=3399691 RepID=UPI003AFA2CA7
MKFAEVRSSLPPVPAADDNRHVLRDVPHSREANALMFQVPEEGLAGFVYFWVTREGMAGTAAYIFGPSIGEPILERFDATPVSPEMDYHDWKVDGLTAKVGAPHQHLDFAFSGKRVKITAHYEASHPVYAFSSHKDGCPPYYADDRTEQHGVLTGELVVDGKRIALNHFMQRDHSWGPRVWGLNQHYKWFHATTHSASVHFFEMQSFGKVLVRGFVAKDGRMEEIVGLDYDFEFDETMYHKSFDVVVTDAAGRKTDIKCQVYARIEFDADPMIYLKEGATTLVMDGEDGTGWCEFCWNRNYFDFAKNFAAQYS